MSERIRKHIYILFIIIGGILGCSAIFASGSQIPYLPQDNTNNSDEEDKKNVKFSVKKTFTEDWEDIDKQNPIDLKAP